MTIDWLVRRDKAVVARRHQVEKQIRELESRPAQQARTEKLKKLRQELVGR